MSQIYLKSATEIHQLLEDFFVLNNKSLPRQQSLFHTYRKALKVSFQLNILENKPAHTT